MCGGGTGRLVLGFLDWEEEMMIDARFYLLYLGIATTSENRIEIQCLMGEFENGVEDWIFDRAVFKFSITFAFLLVTVVVQQSIGHLKMAVFGHLIFVRKISPLIWRGEGILGARVGGGGLEGPAQSAGGWRGGRGRCWWVEGRGWTGRPLLGARMSPARQGGWLRWWPPPAGRWSGGRRRWWWRRGGKRASQVRP